MGGLLKRNGDGDGHIPRNLRLSLLLVDAVEPYVQWTGATHRACRPRGGVKLTGLPPTTATAALVPARIPTLILILSPPFLPRRPPPAFLPPLLVLSWTGRL